MLFREVCAPNLGIRANVSHRLWTCEKGRSHQLTRPLPNSDPSQTPFHLQYLGGYFPRLKSTLCTIVSFSHHLLQPEANYSPFVFDFLACFSACIAIHYLGPSRPKRSLLSGFPLLTGIIHQLYTGVVSFAAAWPFFLVVTHDDAPGSIVQADSDAALFGTMIEYLSSPRFAMDYIVTLGPTALRQISVLISAFLDLLWRPRHLYDSSGYMSVQAIYILLFNISATFRPHISRL